MNTQPSNKQHRYDSRCSDDMRESEIRTLYCHNCKTYHEVQLKDKQLIIK